MFQNPSIVTGIFQKSVDKNSHPHQLKPSITPKVVATKFKRKIRVSLCVVSIQRYRGASLSVHRSVFRVSGEKKLQESLREPVYALKTRNATFPLMKPCAILDTYDRSAHPLARFARHQGFSRMEKRACASVHRPCTRVFLPCVYVWPCVYAYAHRKLYRESIDSIGSQFASTRSVQRISGIFFFLGSHGPPRIISSPRWETCFDRPIA